MCLVSGTVPQDPVVSVKSGHLFERRLIETYIDEQHRCPITGQDLSKADLLTVESKQHSRYSTSLCMIANKVVTPRSAAATSIPSVLSLLQNEWDAVMLETFALKQQYLRIRQELSEALYQKDAASRVIARLMKDRDAAKEYVVTRS
jgi:pre-mRNA-processing factor 19